MYNSVKSHLKTFALVAMAQGLFIASSASIASEAKYGFGKPATAKEIAGWDIDIRPDGLGLPPGSGSVADGEGLYEAQCASCHGLFGEGEGRWPVLAGGQGTLTHERPEKTVGSYWPYASTLWDYTRRAMPFTAPQSLTADETYAITAYVLYLNEIVDEDFVLTRENFSTIKMPNEPNFFEDDRPDVNNTACMKNCKDPASIRVTSTIKGVTPLDHLNDDASDAPKQEEGNGHAKAVYEQSCAVCHDHGVAGAPKTGEADAWTDRIATGVDTLTQRAITGYTGDEGVMPAKGGNMSLTDEEVRAAVEYMVEKSQ